MYIPLPPRITARNPSAAAAAAGPPRWASGPDAGPSHSTAAEQPSLRHLLPDAAATEPNPVSRTFPSTPGLLNRLASLASSPVTALRKRGSSYRTTNITIGIIVAILVTVFLVAVFVFCHRYRPTIRFSRKKKRQRHRSGGSKSSKASTDGGSPAAEAVPAPAA